MTSVALPRAAQRMPRLAQARTIAEGRRERIEQSVLFLVAWLAYFAVGYRYVVQHHVLTVDATSRYAHAFFIWHNDPPKLAAVGFIWAPISTLIFLPAAALRALSTSLVGMPLTTAAFGAGLIVVLYRGLRVVQMPKLQALTLVLAFGANPMIVYYAVNGMSEVPYLFFLTVAMVQFMLWFLSREPKHLIVCGIMISLGLLTRYEVLLWGFLLVPVLTVAMIRQRVSRDYLEGTLIAFLAPIAYGLGMWIFLNWLIQGNPFYWLTPQTGSKQTEAAAPPISNAVHWDAVETLRHVVDVYWQLFPPTLLVFAALLLGFVLRRGRDMMMLTLAAILAVNVGFIWALTFKTHLPGFTQLRYNMRDMPLTLVAMSWLYLAVGGRWRRHALWLACLVSIVATYPTTWHAMKTFRYQFLEQAFTRSLAQDRDQEGTRSLGWSLGVDEYGKAAHYDVGVGAAQRMGDYVTRVEAPRSSILTDDAQTFWVMLLCGCPQRFFDRIDYGDARWLDAVATPWGRVRYILVTDHYDDQLALHWPALRTPGKLKWAHLVRREPGYLLYRVDARER